MARVRGWLAVGLAALLLASLFWLSRAGRAPAPVRDLRKAIVQGRSQLRQGRPDLAFQAVSDARDEDEGSGEAVALAASALIRMGELRVARLALERAVKLKPDQFEATVTLAELNVDLGNGERGAELFGAAARLRPRDPRVWLALAKVLHDLSEFARAFQAFEKVLELNPNEREALSGVIRSSLSAHEPDKAGPWVARALQAYPDDPEILGLAARQSCAQDRFDESIARADRALAANSQNTDALLARARSLVARSSWDRALPDAERAVASSPGDLETIQLLLMIETRLGMTGRAAATLERRKKIQDLIHVMEELTVEIEKHPDDPRLRTRLGQAALEGGSPVLAGRCFEAALALDPNDRQAREGLDAVRGSKPPGPDPVLRR